MRFEIDLAIDDRCREAGTPAVVSVAEASLAELELVGRTHTIEFNRPEPPRMREQCFYRYRGKLYAPLLGVLSNRGLPYHQALFNEPVTWEQVRQALEDCSGPGQGTEAECLGRMAEIAGRLLDVDGVVFTETPEPRYELAGDRPDCYVALRYSQIAPECYLNANDAEELERAQADAGADAIRERIEVVVPDAFTCDPSRDHPGLW